MFSYPSARWWRWLETYPVPIGDKEIHKGILQIPGVGYIIYFCFDFRILFFDQQIFICILKTYNVIALISEDVILFHMLVGYKGNRLEGISGEQDQ